MFSATGLRILVAIGVLTLGLAAITSAAEPIKQEKKPNKPAQERTSTLAPKTTAKKFTTAEIAGKAPSCFGEAPILGKITPYTGKAGDKVTITGTNFEIGRAHV